MNMLNRLNPGLEHNFNPKRKIKVTIKQRGNKKGEAPGLAVKFMRAG
jgi:hypothetical protein